MRQAQLIVVLAPFPAITAFQFAHRQCMSYTQLDLVRLQPMCYSSTDTETAATASDAMHRQALTLPRAPSASDSGTGLGSRLLVLSCSKRKRPDSGLLPAIERYDGPAFRVIRRYLQTYRDGGRSLDVYVLSAEFGLIPSDRPIPDYDHCMTAERAMQLRSQVSAQMKQCLQATKYDRLLLSVGNQYLSALAGYEKLTPDRLEVIVSAGPQGRKLAELWNWLHGNALLQPRHYVTNIAVKGKACIRGIEVAMAPDQVLGVARQALREGCSDATHYNLWCVLVDGQRVAPKWLVSRLTGLNVSQFQAREARSLLQRLGIKVVSA
jgi:hypothetical protein